MIPKTIFFCWFGDVALDALSKTCISSWEKHLPDYTIHKIGNKAIDEKENSFISFAVAHKLWAFVSDYYRIKVLYELGGIYMDTDMMLLKSLNGLTPLHGFLGAENKQLVNAAIMGFSPQHPLLSQLLNHYSTLNPTSVEEIKQMTIPIIITKVIRDTYKFDSGFEAQVSFHNLTILPPATFYPMPFSKQVISSDYPMYVKDNTLGVHLWNASWVDHSILFLIRNKRYKAAWQRFKKDRKEKNVNFLYLKKMVYAFFVTKRVP